VQGARVQHHGSEPKVASARVARTGGRPAGGRSIDASIDGTEFGRLLFDHISDAVFASDMNGRITYWNLAAERLFGFTAAEAVGRSFEELVPIRTAATGDERELVTALKTGRPWHATGTVRDRDGRQIWLDSTVEPIVVNGRPIGSVSVNRDITNYHEAQQSLVDEEGFINAVLDTAGALVVVLDPQGVVVRFNSACERLSGYGSDEIVGHPIYDAVIPPKDVEAVRGVVSSLAAGAFPNSHENHWRTRSGALRLISWTNTCLTDSLGAVTHVIATGSDITEARRSHEALRGLDAIGRVLAEQGPVRSALDAVLAELETCMGYRFLALYLADGSGLALGAQRGYRDVPARLDVATGVIGRVYRTGVAEFVRDVASDPDYLAGEAGVVAEIAAPLLGDGVTLGVLNLESVQPEGMNSDDLHLARTVADRLSSALRRSQAQETLRDRVRLYAALAGFATAVNAIRDPERLATALINAVGAVVPSDSIVITLLDRSDGRYLVSAVRGLAPAAVGALIEPGVGTAGRAISERKEILTEHKRGTVSSAALAEYQLHETTWAVGVPLINEGVVLGVISVGRYETEAAFTDAEREVFALLGSHAALALANAYLFEEVSALAIHDGLTGLHNRRYFDLELDHAIARFKRRAPAAKLAAIMFDLDHFGDFNRRHGHLAGDAVLRLFGGILRERVRSADLVARFGGEEFVVILEDGDLVGALRVAEEVRREFETRSVVGADGQPLHATVSAGCAAIDPAEPTKEAMLGKADEGLFMAKRAGRNRVVAA
jgi:diguanylate cyclase (GGDEF)-like protein/PAS domain S-box-containing protein